MACPSTAYEPSLCPFRGKSLRKPSVLVLNAPGERFGSRERRIALVLSNTAVVGVQPQRVGLPAALPIGQASVYSASSRGQAQHGGRDRQTADSESCRTERPHSSTDVGVRRSSSQARYLSSQRGRRRLASKRCLADRGHDSCARATRQGCRERSSQRRARRRYRESSSPRSEHVIGAAENPIEPCGVEGVAVR
jgi:hypothetical protein